MDTRGNIRFWTAGAQKGKSTFSTPRASPFRHGPALIVNTLQGKAFGQSTSEKLHSRAYSYRPGRGLTAWQNRAKGDTILPNTLHLYLYSLVINYLLFNIIEVIGQIERMRSICKRAESETISHKVWFVHRLETHKLPLKALLWSHIAHIFPLSPFLGCIRILVAELTGFLRSDTRHELSLHITHLL